MSTESGLRVNTYLTWGRAEHRRLWCLISYRVARWLLELVRPCSVGTPKRCLGSVWSLGPDSDGLFVFRGQWFVLGGWTWSAWCALVSGTVLRTRRCSVSGRVFCRPNLVSQGTFRILPSWLALFVPSASKHFSLELTTPQLGQLYPQLSVWASSSQMCDHPKAYGFGQRFLSSNCSEPAKSLVGS